MIQRRDRHTVRGCVEAFIARFPHPVHTMITDNGGAFTDQFAVYKKGKPEGRPGGAHPFDVVCRRHGIEHRLIRPLKPQTKGMAERFDRRLDEAIRARPPLRTRSNREFANHQQRDAFIHRFVANYNRTRLKCLGHKAPIEMLHHLAEQ